MKVVVAYVPLGAGSGLEVERDQFDGLTALVAGGGFVDGAKVSFLKRYP
jgi:hypothetical protein